MAPTPKPPGQRRRRGAQPVTRALPAEGRQGKAPQLPKRSPAWSKDTRDWWRDVWASPSATQWTEADAHLVIRLARIHEAIADDPGKASLHAAASGLEDRLGLSPRARRALNWEVAPAAADPDASSSAPPAGTDAELRARADKLRERLHVVR
jgi:hypothetical protein